MNYPELFNAIKIRPKHFIDSESFQELSRFIGGYQYCMFAHQLEGFELLKQFQNTWLPEKFKDKDVYAWDLYISDNKTDEEAFNYFFDLWDQFVSEVVK